MKPGDRVRVIKDNPTGSCLKRNDGSITILKMGEEIIIKDYIDTEQKSRQYFGTNGFEKYGDLIIYELDPNNPGWDYNYIPASCVELVATTEGSIFSVVTNTEGDKEWLKTHVCTCDMTTLLRYGCKCFGKVPF